MKLDALRRAGAGTARRAARRRHAHRRVGVRRATTTRRSSAATASRGLGAGWPTRGAPAPRDRPRRPHRPAARASQQDRLHRPQLQRPRRREQDGPAEGAGHLLQGDDRARRPDDDPCVIPRGGTKLDWEVELAVVIGAQASLRRRGARARSRRRLRAAQRLLRARVPARTRRPVGQGQELRHLRADRPVPGHARRDRGPAGARHVADGQRRDAAEGHDREHGLRRARRWSATCSQFMTLLPGRRDQHRHAGRRRARHEAGARLPAGRRRRRARHRRPRAGAAGRWWRTA